MRCCVIVMCLMWVKCSLPLSWIPAINRKLSPSGEKIGWGSMSSHSFSGARSVWCCVWGRTESKTGRAGGQMSWSWLEPLPTNRVKRTSTHFQSVLKQDETMVMFWDRVIHTTDT